MQAYVIKETDAMSTCAENIIKHLRKMGNRDIATHSLRFFKTGKGEYGEGDKFLGIRVPILRKCIGEYPGLRLEDAQKLLTSPLHEARLFSLLILVREYSRKKNKKDTVYRYYLANTKHINNWDLVDCSAEHIVGAHLFDKNRMPLYRLARSTSLWERRIAIVSTFHFIKLNDFSDTLAIAKILMNDREDLIHKAVGWMLREVGKRDVKTLEKFLAKHCNKMPRTMLRYAIEKFHKTKRLAYLEVGKEKIDRGSLRPAVAGLRRTYFTGEPAAADKH